MPRMPCLVLLGLAAGTAPAAAQRLYIAPEIGVYIPTEHLVSATNGTLGELEMGPSIGARVGLWFGDRLGLNLSGAYVPTTFAFNPAGGSPEQRDARLFNGAGQLMLFVLPRRNMLSLFVSGGVGVVSRGGVAFTNSATDTNLSGVVGAGAILRLGGIALNAGADLFSYRAQYDPTGLVSSEVSQRDVQIRLGFGVPVGGSRTPTPIH